MPGRPAGPCSTPGNPLHIGEDGELADRAQRPRQRRAAEKANELTSPHIRTQPQGQHRIGSNEYFDRAQTG